MGNQPSIKIEAGDEKIQIDPSGIKVKTNGETKTIDVKDIKAKTHSTSITTVNNHSLVCYNGECIDLICAGSVKVKNGDVYCDDKMVHKYSK